jgi:integrase
MSEIDAGHLNRLKNDIQKNNTPRATNRIMQYLKTFISWAFEMRYLQNDFARQIKKIKESKIRRGFLEPDESMRLAALDWKDLRVKTAVCLGLFAGLRKGEIRALRWRNIDFEKLTISIEENFTGDYDSTGAPIFKAPKAESNRNFPYLMFAELKAVLIILKAESPFTGPDDLCLVNVWSTTTGNQNPLMQYRPMNEIAIARDFKKMLEAIGISLDEQRRRKLVFHSLRHSFTSLMSVVAPMSAVMQLTGHDSAAAFSGYQHGIKNTAVEAIAAANIYLEQYRDQQAYLPAPDDTPGGGTLKEN